MNCTAEVHQVPGLKLRRPAALRRPTKEIPGLGTLEYVREERCHSWQLSHCFVPTRITLIDEILDETEEPAQAVDFFSALVQKERSVRERAIRARYFEFIDPEFRDPSFEDITAHMDDWIAPYRIERFGNAWIFRYDCSDAPGQHLLRAPQIHVTVEADWSISDVHYFTSGVANDLQVSAYHQRVPPQGFVIDSIADQFIVTPYVKPTPELASLLTECIDQTDALLRTSSGPTEAFYRCAHSLLCRLRDTRFNESG